MIHKYNIFTEVHFRTTTYSSYFWNKYIYFTRMFFLYIYIELSYLRKYSMWTLVPPVLINNKREGQPLDVFSKKTNPE